MGGAVGRTLSEGGLNGFQSVMSTALGGDSLMPVSGIDHEIGSTHKLVFNEDVPVSKIFGLFYALGCLLCEFTGRKR